MFLNSRWLDMRVCSLVSACFASLGCAAEPEPPALVGELRQALEEGCVQAPADVTGDVFAILGSTDPLDPAQPQSYGSESCSGVVFELDNPDGEPLRGAWVQASGVSRDESDALSEARCPNRSLEAEYWGYKDNEWLKLTAAEESATFSADAEGGETHCALDALMLHEGTYEKLRIVARVTQEEQTYPMHACVW